jgi:ketosteroid isomerase-like protein
MTMTRADVQAWLDRYVAAWASYDPDAIRALFAEDAEYRYHPWDEPTRGRESIVGDWLGPSGAASTRDEPGTWEARYEPFVVDGDRAVATGETVYFADASHATELRRYANNWLLTFDGDGRCREFVEYFMKVKR